MIWVEVFKPLIDIYLMNDLFTVDACNLYHHCPRNHSIKNNVLMAFHLQGDQSENAKNS